MLNTVDLPQPDGPMMDTNSPGAIENDTSSTAVIVPSPVMKRLRPRSTASRREPRESITSVAAPEGGAGSTVIGSVGAAPTLHKRGAHRRGVARLHAHVDNRDAAVQRRAHRLLQRGHERIELPNRTPALRALRPCDGREIDFGIGDALADPLVLDRPVAHACDALLMHFVVVERDVVGDDE